MPAAAVIPAPVAYIKVVAVKKLVVGPGPRPGRPASPRAPPAAGASARGRPRALHWAAGAAPRASYCEKIRVLKAGPCPDGLAWNNEAGRAVPFSLVAGAAVMINRDSRGRQYRGARGEILRPPRDYPLRKHSPRMFSLISERKSGDRKRSDTVVVPTVNGAGWGSGGADSRPARHPARNRSVRVPGGVRWQR